MALDRTAGRPEGPGRYPQYWASTRDTEPVPAILGNQAVNRRRRSQGSNRSGHLGQSTQPQCGRPCRGRACLAGFVLCLLLSLLGINLEPSILDAKAGSDDTGSSRSAVAAAGPHGGYSAITDDCALCHRSHTGANAPLIGAPVSGDAFCYTCHDGTGASLPPYVSTHSNIDLPGVEASFELLCVQCHDPHGSSNLAAVRENVYVVYPNLTSGPVVLSARTGAGSFDDGTGSAAGRICTVCHDNPANPGYPMTNHIGGASHGGGTDYTGTDCIYCHPHSADTATVTRDGFMPTGGGCSGCHSRPVDNDDGQPAGGRRQITGAGGDFERASHHVAGEVDDADCEACHEQTQHMAGFVRLYSTDNPGIVYVLDGAGDLAELEAFCLACHDVDGAGGRPPFSDGLMPAEIDPGAWSAASHSATGGYSCFDCHNNGHGSNKRRLLAPWDFGGDGDTDDPMREEERFCHTCHDVDGPANSDVASTFASPTNWVAAPAGENSNPYLNDRHDIALSDQLVSGTKIECADCHDPHTTNSSLRVLADPDPNDGRTPGTGYFSQIDGSGTTWTTSFLSDWCLDCHDGTYGPAITPPTITTVDIHASWATAGSTHGAASGSARTVESGYGYVEDMIVQCLDCHTRHISGATPVSGSTNLYHLKTRVQTAGGSGDVPTDNGSFQYEYVHNDIRNTAINGYDWCQTCHVSSMGHRQDGCDDCHHHGLSGRW